MRRGRQWLKRFGNLFRQDLQIVVRNGFLYMVLGLAALIVPVINFVVPEQVKITPTEMFADLTEEKVFERTLRKEGVEEHRLFADREELERKVARTRNSIGISMEGDLENPRFTVIHQGTEAAANLNLLDAALEGAVRVMRGAPAITETRVESLRPKAPPVPFNKGLLPVLLVFEVVMLGFIVIAVMVFQEKQEGTVRAYRITPAGVFEYVFAKAAVNVLLALVYGGLLVLFTMGLRPGVNYLPLFGLIALTGLLMTLAGLLVSVFFRNISEFLFAGLAVLGVFSLPAVSYLLPSFAPAFLTWIPSYPVVFGAREILFPTGKEGFLEPLLGTLAVECTVLLAAGTWAVTRQLLKEGT